MSEVKVNKISPRTACGTTTLGDSGDTFTIPSGVTFTNNGTAAGFGATGAASWDTTVKTSGFTAVSGVGYFVNTTAGAITVTLPASPSAGAVVAVADYANTADTNNITLARNSSNIEGNAADFVINQQGISITLVYVDATKGWITTDTGNSSDAYVNDYIVATGGTETTSSCGDYKIHTFTGPGTLCVTSSGTPVGSDTVDYLVVAGGGGGDSGFSNRAAAGGGGAGGYRASGYGPSPLQGLASSVSIQGYPVTVGAGGAQDSASNGANSIFAGITSAGGGFGFGGLNLPTPGAGPGGSGGGGDYAPNGTPGAGNTPPVDPPQGNAGGNGNEGPSPADPSSVYPAGGGGGAMAVGGDGPGASSGQVGGAGGAGAPNAITGSAVFYAGGGGGGVGRPSAVRTGGPGGNGGGGTGATGAPGVSGGAGTANTGGGGGGGSPQTPSVGPGGAGGSGIVIIRYKFQN